MSRVGIGRQGDQVDGWGRVSRPHHARRQRDGLQQGSQGVLRLPRVRRPHVVVVPGVPAVRLPGLPAGRGGDVRDVQGGRGMTSTASWNREWCDAGEDEVECEVCGEQATGESGGLAETNVETPWGLVAVCLSCAESWDAMNAEREG